MVGLRGTGECSRKSKVKSQIEEVKPLQAVGFYFFNLTSDF
jgi:hypothetical protein